MKLNLPEHLSKNVAELYNLHRDKIFFYIRKRVATVEDAEDITAEVFEKVFKKVDDFKWQGVSIESWIYTIARNSIIDHHRKNSKYIGQVQLEEIQAKQPDSEKDLLASLLDAESYTELYQAISQLESDDQYLIYYKYFEELSNSEIAARMDISETNVGTKLHRLRQKLVKLINLES